MFGSPYVMLPTCWILCFLRTTDSCLYWDFLIFILYWLYEFLCCRTNWEYILHHFLMACATPPLAAILPKWRNFRRYYYYFGSKVVLWSDKYFTSVVSSLIVKAWSWHLLYCFLLPWFFLLKEMLGTYCFLLKKRKMLGTN